MMNLEMQRLIMVIVNKFFCIYCQCLYSHKSQTDSRAAVPVASHCMSFAADLMMQIERRAAEGSAMFRSIVHNVN